MAKRFIDTGFYSSPFVRGLKGPYKALFNYLMLNCDHAGVWQVELDIAATRLDQKRIDPMEALKSFGGKVVELSGGTKWFLVNFIEWQYGELNAANRAHASVIAILKSNGIAYPFEPSTEKKEGASEGLTSSLQGAKDMDTDKELDKDNTSEKERATIAFESLWKVYEGHGTKKLALERWLKLPAKDREAIAAAAPAFVGSTPGGKYRNYLEGWINPANRLWERPVMIKDQPETPAAKANATIMPRGGDTPTLRDYMAKRQQITSTKTTVPNDAH